MAEEVDVEVRDAFAAVLEIYREQGRSFPPELKVTDPGERVQMDLLVAVP